jgi:hypothetical protein
MKTKGALFVSLALLIALCMTASACWVCGSVEEKNRIKIGDQIPGSTVKVTVPGGLPAGMTWVWTLTVQHQDFSKTSTTITPAAGTNYANVLVPMECGSNVEMGVVITMSNQNFAECTLAKCIYWDVPCATCPKLPSFCQGKADDADAKVFNSVGAPYYWMVGGTKLDANTITAADLNKFLCTPTQKKTACLYLDSTKLDSFVAEDLDISTFVPPGSICCQDFYVYCNPPDFTPTAS